MSHCPSRAVTLTPDTDLTYIVSQEDQMLRPRNCGFLVPKQKRLLFSRAAPQLANVTVDLPVLLEVVRRAPVRVGGYPQPEW